MFSGRDPEHKAYRGRAHLASIITLLGLPPAEFLARGSLSARFFSNGTYDSAVLWQRQNVLTIQARSMPGSPSFLPARLTRWRPTLTAMTRRSSCSLLAK